MQTTIETWLSAISLGTPSDIPSDQLAIMVQIGYCDTQYRIDLHKIPASMYHCCYTNRNCKPDEFSRLMREKSQPPVE